MSLPSAVQGATRPAVTITWLRYGTTDPEDLTNATITGVLQSTSTGEARAISGTLAVVSGPDGTFLWEYDEEDVESADVYYAQFTATFATGLSPARTILERWTVHEALAVPVEA